MRDEERLKKQKELRQIWRELIKRANLPPTSRRPTTEAPLDLNTKRPNANSQQSYDNKRIKILEDKIIHSTIYVPPNVYIENNYYEPISPPENTDINSNEPNTTSDPNNEATTTVHELLEEQVAEYHVVTHGQYLEYLSLKKHFENAQADPTEDTKDTESQNINQQQENIPNTRELRIQKLIGMSDEYKNFILSILNQVKTSDIPKKYYDDFTFSQITHDTTAKGKQVKATVTSNPNQESVHLAGGGINTMPANVPIGIQNNPVLNVRNEWQDQRPHVDADETIYPKVPYVNQVPRRDYQQNDHEAVPTKTNQRYTVIPSGPQQFAPHTYSQQQSLPHTFVPSSQRFSDPTSQSDRQNLYSDTYEPNYPEQRWGIPVTPVTQHQEYQQRAMPSIQTQTYTENEMHPIILIPQQKPNPTILINQDHVEESIPVDRLRYPERVALNNQQQVFPGPVEQSSQYSTPTNYHPQRYEEPVMPSDHQVYSERVVPSSQQNYYERTSRRIRQQRDEHEQHVPAQHPMKSNASQNGEQNIKLHDPYGSKHQQLYLKEIERRSQEQRYRSVPEIPQRYHNPVPTNEHATHPTVMNRQPYRYSIPSVPHAPQQVYPEPTATTTKPNTQPKRQYQRRKETTQRQHPASLRWQRIHTSPVQTHIPQVSPEMARRMQPVATEVSPRLPTPEQIPDYYQQYYNQQHENPQVYRNQNYHHPYP